MILVLSFKGLLCYKTSQKHQYPQKDSLCATQLCFSHLCYFFDITLVDGFMVVKAFTDMELYIFSVHLLFVGGSIFQLPSSG